MFINRIPLKAFLYSTLIEKSVSFVNEMTGGQLGIGGLVEYAGVIPAYIWVLSFSAMKIALCFVFWAVRRSFFKQAGAALVNEPVQTLKYGFSLFFILSSLALMFFISVAGIPVMLIILAFFLLGSVMGQVSLGLDLGFYICARFNIRARLPVCMLAGLLLLELIFAIPYAGTAAMLGASILSLGMIALGFVNAFIRKRFYDAPFAAAEPKRSDRERVRAIITGSAPAAKKAEGAIQ